jgi:hypothetical protein
MMGKDAELWKVLCEQAVSEQDPQKLMLLIAEIDRLLTEKQDRLNRKENSPVRTPPAGDFPD